MSSPSITQKRKHKPDIIPTSEQAKHAREPEIPRGADSSAIQIFHILHMPDEILMNIILRLNARERVGLGSVCKRFNNLIFKNEKLLEYLDFSKDGHLTSRSDIEQYFTETKSCEHIFGVNLKNTDCIVPGLMLNTFIGRAKNIVDINLSGMKFEDIWQLGAFLNPLLHLRRLSFDWPETGASSIPMCCKILQHPFSRLEYLSVETATLDYVKVFIPSLRLCQEIKKLRLVVKKSDKAIYSDSWGGDPKELKNLEVAEYCGPLAMQIKERFRSLLPNPEKWADFKLQNSSEPEGFYLALVEVCEKLAAIKESANFQNAVQENDTNLGWALIPELLLKEVLKITHDNVPEEFCCLSTFMDEQRCLLKTNEIERLLKDPGFEISCLYTNHPVHLGCDIHLVASAFQNLMELVLPAITRNQESLPMDSHFERRLEKKGEAVPKKQTESLNMDSSFKMLVKNTPNLRHFTLGGCGSHDNWDLEELYSITGWKYLETLRLQRVPIKDGQFLLSIGRQCKNLQNLELTDLGPKSKCPSFGRWLSSTLKSCRNLRYFSIKEAIVGELSTLFTSLAKNVQLRKVHIEAWDNNNYKPRDLIAAITKLLCDFALLTTFVSDVDCTPSSYASLLSDIESLERNRPNLQIKVALNQRTMQKSCSPPLYSTRPKRMKRLREDAPEAYPFPYIYAAE